MSVLALYGGTLTTGYQQSIMCVFLLYCGFILLYHLCSQYQQMYMVLYCIESMMNHSSIFSLLVHMTVKQIIVLNH